MGELFERERELAEIDAHERAAAGLGRVVLVEGPAGIGKSGLLAEARRRAERSMRVLPARGSGLEAEFAFGVVRQLLESQVAAGRERRDTLLAGAAASAATVVGDPGAGAEGASYASLHGLFWLVLNLAEEAPLLLTVDDLHWCDRESLLFLACWRGARCVPATPTGTRPARPSTSWSTSARRPSRSRPTSAT